MDSLLLRSAGRYEVDGYVYSADEVPKMLITGKWNEFVNYQPCDAEGEPLPGTKLEEVSSFNQLPVTMMFLSSFQSLDEWRTN